MATLITLSSVCGLIGCAGMHGGSTTVFRWSGFETFAQELADEHPATFSAPFSLVVMLDRQPCGRRVAESRLWASWQRHMVEAGGGLLFATSRVDSAGLAYAARLDGVEAPVLVLESYLNSNRPGSGWQAYAPWHFLCDSTGKVLGVWGTVFDDSQSSAMMNAADSLMEEARGHGHQ